MDIYVSDCAEKYKYNLTKRCMYQYNENKYCLMNQQHKNRLIKIMCKDLQMIILVGKKKKKQKKRKKTEKERKDNKVTFFSSY